jgi:hypothetical protein
MSGGCCSPLTPSSGPGSGLVSFAGRTAPAVIPQASDYAAFYPEPPPVAGTNDGAVALAGTGGSAGLLVYLKGVAGSILSWSVSAASWVASAVAPFQGLYYVNPGFTGLQAGSASNPYTTVAAAFAAMVALALPGGTVVIPAGVVVTENIVFPDTGGKWEIASPQALVLSLGGVSAQIVGTVTFNTSSAGTSAFALTNIFVNGALSGANSSSGLAYIFLTGVRVQGGITTTRSSTGLWLHVFKGVAAPQPSKVGGSFTQLANCSGQVFANDWVFEGGVTENSQAGTFNPPIASTFRNCQFGATTGSTPPINLSSNSLVAYFYDCVFTGVTTFTTLSANYVINMCPFTYGSLNKVGCVLSGTTITLNVLTANAASERTLANNLGSTNFGGRNAEGQYECTVTQTLLATGTNGSLQGNVIYTDMTGTLVTVPVGTALNITSAVGTKAEGALRFQHNGAAAPIAFSYTGIVTPGAMSVATAIAIRRCN